MREDVRSLQTRVGLGGFLHLLFMASYPRAQAGGSRGASGGDWRLTGTAIDDGGVLISRKHKGLPWPFRGNYPSAEGQRIPSPFNWAQ